MAIIHSILPPLMINTALGTILFTSHSFFCYLLSKLDYFAPRETSTTIPLDPGTLPHLSGDERKAVTSAIENGQESEADHQDGVPEWFSFGAEDQIMFMEAIHRLPHPTLMSAVAGAAAGVLQAVIFAPIENAVK
jgi:hypothetical protein